MRPTEEFRVPAIAFLGEQDGTVERSLKEALAKLLAKETTILAAYVARVHYRESPVDSVALCLRSNAPPDRALVDRIGGVFALIFNPSEHLDILFLTMQQRAAIDNCCLPFFRRDS
jgi:hypothetical protein